MKETLSTIDKTLDPTMVFDLAYLNPSGLVFSKYLYLFGFVSYDEMIELRGRYIYSRISGGVQ